MTGVEAAGGRHLLRHVLDRVRSWMTRAGRVCRVAICGHDAQLAGRLDNDSGNARNGLLPGVLDLITGLMLVRADVKARSEWRRLSRALPGLRTIYNQKSG